jgi:hypothetical protein
MGQSLSGLEFKVYTGSDRVAEDKFRDVQRHRCDKRAEDFCRVLAGGWAQLRDNAPTAFRNLRECYASEEGWVAGSGARGQWWWCWDGRAAAVMEHAPDARRSRRCLSGCRQSQVCIALTPSNPFTRPRACRKEPTMPYIIYGTPEAEEPPTTSSSRSSTTATASSTSSGRWWDRGSQEPEEEEEEKPWRRQRAEREAAAAAAEAAAQQQQQQQQLEADSRGSWWRPAFLTRGPARESV